MSDLSLLDNVCKILKGDSKGKELMMIGVILVVLSNYIQPLAVTYFNSPHVLLWLGVLTFIYGLAIHANERESKRWKI